MQDKSKNIKTSKWDKSWMIKFLSGGKGVLQPNYCWHRRGNQTITNICGFLKEVRHHATILKPCNWPRLSERVTEPEKYAHTLSKFCTNFVLVTMQFDFFALCIKLFYKFEKNTSWGKFGYLYIHISPCVIMQNIQPAGCMINSLLIWLPLVQYQFDKKTFNVNNCTLLQP